MSGESNWAHLLPTELVTAGREVHTELAWKGSDVVRVVEALEHAGCTILGIDAWIFDPPSAKFPTPLGLDWDAERDASNWHQFVTAFDDSSRVEWFNVTAENPKGGVV